MANKTVLARLKLSYFYDLLDPSRGFMVQQRLAFMRLPGLGLICSRDLSWALKRVRPTGLGLFDIDFNARRRFGATQIERLRQRTCSGRTPPFPHFYSIFFPAP